LFLHIKNGFTNGSQCCVMRTLPTLFILLALIKNILFRWTITSASIDISSNMQGIRKCSKISGCYSSWNILWAFLGGTE